MKKQVPIEKHFLSIAKQKTNIIVSSLKTNPKYWEIFFNEKFYKCYCWSFNKKNDEIELYAIYLDNNLLYEKDIQELIQDIKKLK